LAKYVLVAFDKDADAEEFVAEVQGRGGVVTPPDVTPAIIRGVWKKPTKFCTGCTGRKGYTRGKKYGWWVCVSCGKPSQGWANGDHWMTALGTNLLPISEVAPEYRGPGQLTHPGYVPKANWCQQEGRFMFRAEPGGPCPNCGNTLTLSPIHQNVGANAEPAKSTESTGSEGS
jgi:hypothetical protein